ncbi:MAG TPA: hypothetical protein VFJ12_10755 [Segeticoccus sp.]|nr:hypothetical protein [Segeticoccus sp.]
MLSRGGRSDFHALTTTAGGVVGFDGRALTSTDGRSWTTSTLQAPPRWLAGSPDHHTVLATELRRVLAPEGRLVLVLRMDRDGVSPANPSVHGLTEDQLDALVGDVEHRGFGHVVVHRREWPRETMAAVVASGRRAGDRPV